MLLLYTDDVFAGHDTGQHPECPARIKNLNALLQTEGWTERCEQPTWSEVTRDQIAAVHSVAYLDKLRQWCADAVGRIEADTVVSRGSWPAAMRAAGAACDAVGRVMQGPARTAFCAIRPPGHHALPSGPMGFCLLNNVAIAAHAAIAGGAARVLVVDWDVHHGNGTQDTFYEDGRVGFYSIHRSPFYPGTGAAAETGSRNGLGWIANSPVDAKISTKDYMAEFRNGLEALADRVRPELILISAGFDAHQADPVGSLCLFENDFATLTDIVADIARTHAHGRIVSLLEGGYHLDHMPTSVHEHLLRLEAHESANQ